MKKILVLLLLLTLLFINGCNTNKTDNSPLEGLPSAELYFKSEDITLCNDAHLSRFNNSAIYPYLKTPITDNEKINSVINYLDSLNLVLIDTWRVQSTYSSFEIFILDCYIQIDETNYLFIGHNDNKAYVIRYNGSYIPAAGLGVSDSYYIYQSPDSIPHNDFWHSIFDILEFKYEK